MGAIQSAVNRMIGSAAGAGALISGLKRVQPADKQKMKQSLSDVEQQKLLRAKQRANLEQQRAKYQKAKLQKEQAKLGLKDLKAGQQTVTIGGAKISDPNLLKKIKEQTANGTK